MSPFSLMRQQHGYTLVELVVVSGIVAVLAAIALPGSNPPQYEKLELAAAKVAEVLRFARAESIRTGEVHGVQLFGDWERLIVSVADMTLDTPYPDKTPANPLSIVYDPISLQRFDIDLSQSSTRGVDLDTNPFKFSVGGRDSVLFDAHGMPFQKDSGSMGQLEEGAIKIELGAHRLDVTLAPFTGRVTIE